VEDREGRVSFPARSDERVRDDKARQPGGEAKFPATANDLLHAAMKSGAREIPIPHKSGSNAK
jgi:hypothetical protein